jgi:anti-sigma factor RsiW
MNETLTCEALVELVTAYLDGALSPADHRDFEAHLAECDDCVRHVEQMRRTIAITGRLTQDDVPAAALATLLAAFRAARPAQSSDSRTDDR